MSSAIVQWSAVDTAEKVRSGEVSASDVTEAHLDHLAVTNPALNAVTRTNADSALAAARAIDDAIAAGQPVGPLAGVPVTIKDNVDVAGQSTPNGLPHLDSTVAEHDSPAVSSLRDAGAIVIGRTNAPEFSWRWHTDNPLFGPTINPRCPERTPGGSSGGASAALASGIGCLALGNDAGGSVRWPASCTGVTALRPTVGRIASHNATAPGERPLGVDLMAVQGPMARTIDDLSLMLGVLATSSWRDPNHVPVGERTIERRHRFGLYRSETAPPHPFVATALDRAVEALEAAGLERADTTLPSLDEAATAWATLINADFEMTARPAMERFGGEAIQLVLHEFDERSDTADLPGVYRALATRAGQLRAWLRLFAESVDVVVLPVCLEPAWPAGDDLRPGRMSEIFDANTTMVAINLLGLPAAAVGVGEVDGVPVGVQIVGSRFDEAGVLATASIIERAFPPNAIEASVRTD